MKTTGNCHQQVKLIEPKRKYVPVKSSIISAAGEDSDVAPNSDEHTEPEPKKSRHRTLSRVYHLPLPQLGKSKLTNEVEVCKVMFLKHYFYGAGDILVLTFFSAFKSPISASPTSKASKSVQKTSRNVQKRLKHVQKASKSA